MSKLENIKNSTVLVRTDLNLPSLQDIGRVVAIVPTILQLLKTENKIVLLSHWGRPVGADSKWSLEQMTDLLSQQFGEIVEFVNQYNGIEKAKQTIERSDNKIFLLENTRFEAGEQSKDKQERRDLAQQYAILGEYFVDEAFAVSHRHEATNYELKHLLPNALGLNYEQEIEHLDKIKYHAKHPYLVIISGSKLETKLPLIEKFLEIANYILLGGMICFTFIEARRRIFQEKGDVEALNFVPDLADSPIEEDFLPRAIELLKKYEKEIVLPLDFNYFTNPDGKVFGYDIGLKTIKHFESLLQRCDTVFWNGPMGVYEMPPFNQGTIEIAHFLAEKKDCYVVIGGGDINSAVPREYLDKFAWVSTGGGATLEYLSAE